MKEKQYIFESFDSVARFIDIINSRPVKQEWGYTQSTADDESWTTTKSYEEASDLALYGDRKAADKVEQSIKKLRADKASREERVQSRVVRSVVGSRPCVPAAVMGHPASMYRRLTTKVKKPVVTIYYSISMHGGTDAKILADAGAKMTEAILTIERSGVRVNLYAGNTSCTDSQSIGAFVRIKDSSKDFDLLRMAYPLINPSFFRRHWFHWAETKNELNTKEWRCGYGRPLYSSEEKKTLSKMKENRIKCDFLFTTSNVLEMTAEEIANRVLGNQ